MGFRDLFPKKAMKSAEKKDTHPSHIKMKIYMNKKNPSPCLNE